MRRRPATTRTSPTNVLSPTASVAAVEAANGSGGWRDDPAFGRADTGVVCNHHVRVSSILDTRLVTRNPTRNPVDLRL